MKNNIVSPELQELIDNQSEICLSIIIPLHKNPVYQKNNILVIDHALEKATDLLNTKYGSFTEGFRGKIKALASEVRLTEGSKGIGLFVSEAVSKSIHFPFEVTEKIIVSDSFEIRDVLYKQQFLKDYFVVSISTDSMTLWKGNGNSLKAVTDENFPASFVDDREYAKPSPGNSSGHGLKEFEKDKSVVKEMLAESFYNTYDKKLKDYLHPKTPMILAGVTKDIGYYNKVTDFKNNIIGTVTGSYDQNTFNDLQERAWKVYNDYLVEEQEKMVANLKELVGNKLVTTGLKDIWRDAESGKGNILVVEKNFTKSAFLGQDEFKLLKGPPEAPHKEIPDAVNNIIATVLEKSGEVFFTDDGALNDFEGIALITRY